MGRVLKSFHYAIRGLVFALRYERNFIIECATGGAALLLSFWLPLSLDERAIVILTVGLVLCLELVNTAIERVMDVLKPRVHPYVRVIKDVVAGAVLLAALTAFFVGACIFYPYFF